MYVYHVVCVFFFFFQAEDGIRDWSVTGVQTCALPISVHASEPVDVRGQLHAGEHVFSEPGRAGGHHGAADRKSVV